jgi:hypothetical protein
LNNFTILKKKCCQCRGTRGILKSYRTTLKFAAIKGILIIAAIQEAAVSSIAGKKSNLDGTPFSTAFKARFWAAFFVTIEGFILTLMLIYAFPLKELSEEVKSDASRSALEVQLDATLMEPMEKERRQP